MPFSGSGTFSPYTPGNPVVSGSTISSSAFNNTIQDIATGLTNAITRDGQSPATADIPMGGHKLTGLAAAAANGDAVRFEQLASYAPLASPTFTGTVTAPTFAGALTGNVTGNVTGSAGTAGTAANLSGTPTLPNGTTAALQAVADSSSLLATTAFVNPSFNISGSGWVKLPSGLFLQWMPFTTASGTVNITWPIAFPTAVYGVVASTLNGTNVVTTVNTQSTTGATIFTHVGSTGAGISNTGFVIALGK